MIFAPRIRPRTKPRRGRIRDQAYLDWLHTQPSIVPSHDLKWCLGNWPSGCWVTVHHVRHFGSPKDDHAAVPLWLCRHLHDCGNDSIEHGKAAFEKRFGLDLEQIIRDLNERFKREEA